MSTNILSSYSSNSRKTNDMCNSNWTFTDGKVINESMVSDFVRNLFTSHDDLHYGRKIEGVVGEGPSPGVVGNDGGNTGVDCDEFFSSIQEVLKDNTICSKIFSLGTPGGNLEDVPNCPAECAGMVLNWRTCGGHIDDSVYDNCRESQMSAQKSAGEVVTSISSSGDSRPTYIIDENGNNYNPSIISNLVIANIDENYNSVASNIDPSDVFDAIDGKLVFKANKHDIKKVY